MPPCEMPKDFDSASWDRLGAIYGRHSNKAAWDGLANAHNGIAFRFHAMAAADERFAAHFSPSGPRCVEEEALFSFFYNAISCLECALYGLHHLGALSIALGFPIASDGDLRAINRTTVRTRFEKAFPEEPLTILLGKVLDDPRFKRLLDFRDVLTHRGTVPRNNHVTLREPGVVRIPEDTDAVMMQAKPKSAKDQSLMELDAKTTSGLRAWLAVSVCSILTETVRFSEARLPSETRLVQQAT